MALVSSKKLIELYGNPSENTLQFERKNLVVFDVPDSIEKLNSVMPQ